MSLVSIIMMVVAGCQTPAQRLEPKAADAIIIGVTTRDDLVKAYGEPNQVLMGDGRTLLCWQFIYWASPPRSDMFSPSEESCYRALTVLLDNRGRVLKKLPSEHNLHTFYAQGAVVIGRKPEANVLSRIKINITTQKELVAILGEPIRESLSLEGNLILDWGYSTGDFIAGQTQLHLLRAIIDVNGRVAVFREVNEG